MRILLVLIPAMLIAGCASSGVSESDAASVRQEFSKENYEKAMKESGRGAELEEERKKEEAFLKGGENDRETGQH